MSLVLTVTDINEVNSKDGYMSFKPDDYGYIFGYSCLTPQGEATNIKQYEVSLGDDYYTSYFCNDRYYVDCPFGVMDRLPYIGESYTVQKTQIRPILKSDRLIRVVPRDICY